MGGIREGPHIFLNRALFRLNPALCSALTEEAEELPIIFHQN